MAWITASNVEMLLRQDLESDTTIDALIEHAQALAEIEVGEQATPSAGLKAVLVQIVARFWQAAKSAEVNPAGLQSDTTGPFSFSNPNAGAAGLGLTNREKRDLKKAAKVVGMWIQPIGSEEAEEEPYARTWYPL